MITKKLKTITSIAIVLLSSCVKQNNDFENPSTPQKKSKHLNTNLNQYANNTGVLFLSDQKYAALPKADFSLLRQNSITTRSSNSASLSTAMTSDATYLITPTSGNQGGEGSCVAWAVGYSAMGILTLPKLNYVQNSLRSPEYIYNQIKVNNCDGGSYTIDALNLIKNQGVCSWNLMPYTDVECSTIPNQIQRNDAANNKSSSFGTLNPRDSYSIKQAIGLGWPVVVAFDVTTAFDNMWNTNGIWTTNTTSKRGGHATCIVGYDDSRQMFKVQNQWGSSGGDGNGFFWVSYALVNSGCFREAYVVYTNVSSTPLSLMGSKDLCTSATYTIPNIPQNSTVIWTAKPTGIVTISPNGNSATVTKISEGTFDLEATVINSSGRANLTLNNIKAGTPVPTHIDGTKREYAPNSSYHFSSDGTDWVVMGGTILGGQGTNSILVETNSSGQLRIAVRRINSCGTSGSFIKVGTINSDQPPI